MSVLFVFQTFRFGEEDHERVEKGKQILAQILLLKLSGVFVAFHLPQTPEVSSAQRGTKRKTSQVTRQETYQMSHKFTCAPAFPKDLFALLESPHFLHISNPFPLPLNLQHSENIMQQILR